MLHWHVLYSTPGGHWLGHGLELQVGQIIHTKLCVPTITIMMMVVILMWRHNHGLAGGWRWVMLFKWHKTHRPYNVALMVLQFSANEEVKGNGEGGGNHVETRVEIWGSELDLWATQRIVVERPLNLRFRRIGINDDGFRGRTHFNNCWWSHAKIYISIYILASGCLS